MRTVAAWHNLQYVDYALRQSDDTAQDSQRAWLHSVPAPLPKSATKLASDGFRQTTTCSRHLFSNIGQGMAEAFVGSARPVSQTARNASYIGWGAGTCIGVVAGVCVGFGTLLNPHPERAHAAARQVDCDDFCYDATNQDIYNNDSPTIIRVKCFALALGNPVINAVNAAVTFGTRLHGSLQAAGRADIRAAASGLGAAFAAPMVWIGLEGAALLGIVAPLQGRRLYAQLEAHMAFRLAPCFEPLNPHFPQIQPHLLGGMQAGDSVW